MTWLVVAGRLGHSDHVVSSGCAAATRHSPQSTQIVVPTVGTAAAHRIVGMFNASPSSQDACSVSLEQPEQYLCRLPAIG